MMTLTAWYGKGVHVHYDAFLRVRELTQNIFDIGDEIAEFIDHIAQAIADWDTELVDDCLLELEELVAENRVEVRPTLSELNGLRQAFISGVRSGEMSNTTDNTLWRSPLTDVSVHPGHTLSFLTTATRHRTHCHTQQASSYTQGVRGLAFAPPYNADTNDSHSCDTHAIYGNDASDIRCQDTQANTVPVASTAAWRLWLRKHSEKTIDKLKQVQDWVVEQTKNAVDSHTVLLPQAYSHAEKYTHDIVDAWKKSIAQQPTLARSMRGESPPEFLAERARIDAIITKLQKRRRGKAV